MTSGGDIWAVKSGGLNLRQKLCRAAAENVNIMNNQ